MTETPPHQVSLPQSPWGWAICCSLLAHVGVLLLAGYIQGTRPQLELTPPIKVSLIPLPQQPKKVQPMPIPEESLPRPIQQKPQPIRPKPQLAPRSLAPPAKAETRSETQSEQRVLDYEPPILIEPMKNIIEATPAEAGNLPVAEVIATPTDRIATQPLAQAVILEQLKQNYAGQIRARINQVKRYPLMARKRGREGVVTLEFSIDKQGQLLDSKILLSSGTKSLDLAALNALASAEPFDPPPVGLKTLLAFQIQIHFALRD
jgi:protein TonB